MGRSRASAKRSTSRGNKNAFMVFLQHYRQECDKSGGTKSQKQLATKAGEIWRKMTDEQKGPFIREAYKNKGTDRSSASCEHDSVGARRDVRVISSSNGTPTRTTKTAAVCNNAVQNKTHRLIECLLCQCEYGNYARDILFKFHRKANDFYPELEDEAFYVYLKVLIAALVLVGLLTVLLTLWHFMF